MHAWTRLALPLVALACASRGALSAGGAPGDPSELRRDVTVMMDNAAKAWNRGDLDAFMSDYLDSDRTTFVGGDSVLRGPPAVRRRYVEKYFAPGVRRDSLSFEGIEVDPLAPGVAHVVAFYVLARGDSVVARGPTSLVLLRVGGRWRIVHDHSS